MLSYRFLVSLRSLGMTKKKIARNDVEKGVCYIYQKSPEMNIIRIARGQM